MILGPDDPRAITEEQLMAGALAAARRFAFDDEGALDHLITLINNDNERTPHE